MYDEADLDVRLVHPFEATKEYWCPGCEQLIPARTGHFVVVPVYEPDLRRHWHRGCWEMRHRGPRARRRR